MKHTKQKRAAIAIAILGSVTACSSAAASSGPASTVSNSGQRSTGTSYSRAFADCARAHGLPDFPNPGASITSLGAYFGTATFQAEVNGACRALAPAAWVAPGQVGQNP
jgi:hypothetical protein